ncbi:MULTISPECIES: DegV family protein [unclassified Enterococcus]|uniref:DegV family protein n=1 Tax=unclassified Enterococcus TaxID=2608891 RepID=UPI001552AD95|nr:MULTISPECIES: DegV family protein [unclassified Enterococcus]MBS7577837.1 DegV family protein [Enterococcus sp. MMGLQ5-2]MBS7585097.1 DegV family protein [Enterococcus sp. MMGLQ5-1]NPD12953.1 DegV family protein [Enterococcus sp. MMGLQ5-1]NPD37667.1 DegV family protein [Enterococcus sp. MMGLQ5-2]
MTFQILTDTTSDLPFSYLRDKDVEVLGMIVTIDEQQYDTAKEGALTPELLLSFLDQGKMPTTSQINVAEFEKAFRRYAEKGDELLYLCFSSGLSGTYQSAIIAKEMILEEFPEAQINIIDTLAAAAGEGLLVDLAVQMRDQGMEIYDVIEKLEYFIPRLRSWVLADDLYHLMRGGRVSKTSAIFGTLANIKPIIYVTEAGKLEAVAKVRGQKKGLTYLYEETVKDLYHPEAQTIWIGHSGIKAVAEEMKARILKSTDVQAVNIVPLGPTIASHTGKGTLAVFSLGQTAR